MAPPRLLLVHQRLLDAALVGTQHDEVARRDVQVAHVVVDDWPGVQMIDGYVKKALDLRGVQIQGQDAVGAGDRDEVGHQLRRDRHAALVLAVLPGVAVVGDDGGDPRGAGALEAVQHHEQLHQVLVDRRAGGLNEIDVAAADVFLDADGDLAVGEVGKGDLAEACRRGGVRSSRREGRWPCR